MGALTAGAFGVSKLAPGLPQGLLERFALGAEGVLLVVPALVITRSLLWGTIRDHTAQVRVYRNAQIVTAPTASRFARRSRLRLTAPGGAGVVQSA